MRVCGGSSDPLVIYPPRADGGAPATEPLRIWAMKGTCRRPYRLHCEFNPASAMDKEIATGFPIRAWEAGP
jgi:hypothetical protein